MRSTFFLLGLVGLLWGCRSEPTERETPPIDKLFSLLPPDYTGIDFNNKIGYTETYNPYTFRNFFNGGGVGLGDVNNDGLLDLFFCGNLVGNKLYLNRGNFQFEDITQRAGIAVPNVWTSGVSLADVNGDGWLDIYLCKSGKPDGENRHNELFINNGDLTFTEKAAEYGIDDLGLSTHAAFFDYDKDGDLDCYLLNNSLRSVGGYDLRPGQREIRDPDGGNKLYRNDGNRFTDVSEAANIYGSKIGFGLGVTIGDVNRDTWPDIYVSNDFFERDYLYINNQDGTFRETLEEQMPEISLSSMGADMADLTNDGYPEIFVTDMLPRGDARMKTKTTFENWDKYRMNFQNGYHRQFTRNVLQLNNRNGAFSEIGRMTDVYATDWSWGALLFDMDNDGRKDIFVANGILKDLTDQDYINFYSDPATIRKLMSKKEGVIQELIDAMPSQAIGNYAFRNEGELQFTDYSAEWGLDSLSFSNGSAYGDLDNDGDLDLVTNNVNMPAFIFRNEADTLRSDHHYLKVRLRGSAKNTQALGAQVTVYCDGESFFQEVYPMRGFQSSVDPRLHFGLGEHDRIDSLLVVWPQGQRSLRTGLAADQTLELSVSGAGVAQSVAQPRRAKDPLFRQVDPGTFGIDFRHRENAFVDFDRDQLLFHMRSAEGPRIAVADIDGDNRDDFFIGGAKGSPGMLYVQDAQGRFRSTNQELFAADQASEDTDALFFDANGDGHPDLYVASGGNAFSKTSVALADRLYLNDGNGRFRKSNQLLPAGKFESSSSVDAADYDGDGDMDLFVGIRLQPFLFGVPVNAYLLENEGNGTFRNATPDRAPELLECGLITDGRWLDYDGDGRQDLVVVGEYMPVRVYRNTGAGLEEVTGQAGMGKSNGFWNRIEIGDINGDGLPDLVLANHGLNTRFKASREKPVRMYVNDFDRNGRAEQLVTTYNGDTAYPLVLRHDLVKQLPQLNKQYLKYENYKNQTITDIFSPQQLEGAIQWEVFRNESSVAINQGDGAFKLRALPQRTQMAPMYGLLLEDFDGDGRKDLFAGGNFHYAKPETGIYAATYGQWLRNTGEDFKFIPASRSGVNIQGQIRDVAPIRVNGRRLLLVARNDMPVVVLEW